MVKHDFKVERGRKFGPSSFICQVLKVPWNLTGIKEANQENNHIRLATCHAPYMTTLVAACMFFSLIRGKLLCKQGLT